jgi:hypothetical protein
MFKKGMRDDPMSLFRKEREQMVQINGQESEPGVVKMGVVQAGVFSPTLFNIFNMFSLELNGIIQMYAVIKYRASSLDELFRMINEDMVFSYEPGLVQKTCWALNVEKTSLVLFEQRSAICLSDNHVECYEDGVV